MGTINWKTADDLLSEAKQIKKAQLSTQCNQAITAGFTSSALGTEHTYPSDDEAQRNFHSELDRINLDSTYTTIYFKTFDSGYMAHTIDQFKQVFIDGHTSGRSQIAKLNQLKADVDKATTPDEVVQIEWN